VEPWGSPGASGNRFRNLSGPVVRPEPMVTVSGEWRKPPAPARSWLGPPSDDAASLLLGSRTFGKGLIQTLIGWVTAAGFALPWRANVTPKRPGHPENLGIAPDRLWPTGATQRPAALMKPWLEEAPEASSLDLLDPRP